MPIAQILDGAASYMAEGRVTQDLRLRAAPAPDAVLPEATRRELCKGLYVSCGRPAHSQHSNYSLPSAVVLKLLLQLIGTTVAKSTRHILRYR